MTDIEELALVRKDFNKTFIDSNNLRYKGKYLITESRDGYDDGRMFIRIPTNKISDAYSKAGWWNIFCYAKHPVEKGYWLSQIIEFKSDRNGYENVVVKPVSRFPELGHSALFREDGTWESIAIEFLVNKSDLFHPQYVTKSTSTPNYKALRERFPEYAECELDDIARNLLRLWIDGKIEIKDIEDALNEKTPYENLIWSIMYAIRNNTLNETFPQYPLFCSKIVKDENHTLGEVNSLISYYAVDGYIKDRHTAYINLVNEGKIERDDTLFETCITWESNNGALDPVEKVLEYYEDLKAKKKAEKRAKRKAKKSS
jgi:hypothetical protein